MVSKTINYIDLYGKQKEYTLEGNEQKSEYSCPIDKTKLIKLNSPIPSIRCPCCGVVYGNPEELTEKAIQRISENYLEKWAKDRERHENYLASLTLSEHPEFVDVDKSILRTRYVISRLEKLITLPKREEDKK